LASIAIDGAPEDQLRGPLDVLMRSVEELRNAGAFVDAEQKSATPKSKSKSKG
jgi:hypothetical protein